jgi:hypothetical protein
MRHGGRERGEGKGSVIFWLLFLGMGAFVGMQVVPTKVATMQLKDYAEELCRFEPRKSGEFYQNALFNRAKDLDLPVEKKQIKVDKTLRRAKIEIEFPVTVDLLVTDYVWNIRIYLDRDIFLM